MTEEELCAAFILDAEKAGWQIYPEQGNWDILLVRRGLQVGIQAKLRFCVGLLDQATQRTSQGEPHYRTVLLPGLTLTDNAKKWFAVINKLKLVVLMQPDTRLYNKWGWVHYYNACWAKINWRDYRWHPEKSVWIPPFNPDLPAGVQSPRSVGPWQIAAILLERTCDQQGFVSVKDVKIITKGVDGNWNPYTMLNAYFKCTDELVSDGGRRKKWVLKHRPSDRYPETARGMACVHVQ